MQEIEKTYSTKEVSLTLGIGASTLRKWCLALEENGYKFDRAENNKRLFVERDLVALRYFQKLVQGENFPLGNAAKVIASKYENETSESRTPSVLPQTEEEQRSFKRSDELVQHLIERIEKQEQFNKELLERLDQQHKYINERLSAQEERLLKRDDLLMQSIRASQEAKQEILQIAAAKEEERKKGFWGRLFGK